MAADEPDSDLDPRLARRLAALHPDVADDGFTAALMAELPRSTAAPSTAVWPLAMAAAIVAAILTALVGGGAGTASPELLTRFDASASANMFGGLLDELPALLEAHLYTLVAGAMCAATLLAPQLLED